MKLLRISLLIPTNRHLHSIISVHSYICAYYCYYFYLTAVTVSFHQSSYSVNENTGLCQNVLVLSNPSSTDITVKVRDSNSTAIGE